MKGRTLTTGAIILDHGVRDAIGNLALRIVTKKPGPLEGMIEEADFKQDGRHVRPGEDVEGSLADASIETFREPTRLMALHGACKPERDISMGGLLELPQHQRDLGNRSGLVGRRSGILSPRGPSRVRGARRRIEHIRFEATLIVGRRGVRVDAQEEIRAEVVGLGDPARKGPRRVVVSGEPNLGVRQIASDRSRYVVRQGQGHVLFQGVAVETGASRILPPVPSVDDHHEGFLQHGLRSPGGQRQHEQRQHPHGITCRIHSRSRAIFWYVSEVSPRTLPTPLSLPHPVTSRLASAATMVGFVLAAAILQLLATIKLGLAPIEALERAARDGQGPTLLAVGGLGVAALAGWILRHRPRRAWTVALVLGATVIGGLWTRASGLAIALHGEFVLHHFAALLSAAVCLVLWGNWWSRHDLGRRRFVPMVLGIAGVAGQALTHLHAMPLWSVGWFQGTTELATASLFGALALGPILYWRSVTPSSLRTVTVVLLAVVLLRLALAGPVGLHGAPVPEGRREVLMAAVFVAALIVFWQFRPTNPPAVQALVILLAGVATALLYFMYQRSFGLLEDGVGGLAQSLLAFPLPYPEYVERWRVLVLTAAQFFMFVTVYSALMAYDERVRGGALALLLITGLGLSNAQLVLMCAAAHRLWFETLLESPRPSAESAPKRAMEAILHDVATALGLPPPIMVETSGAQVLSMRGNVDEGPFDLRARQSRGGRWTLRVRLGMLGRGRPEVELVPDRSTSGLRPAHPLRATHRVRGSMRALEGADAALDTLLDFPEAHAAIEPAGSDVQLGQDLARLDADRLVALVRAFVAVHGGSTRQH